MQLLNTNPISVRNDNVWVSSLVPCVWQTLFFLIKLTTNTPEIHHLHLFWCGPNDGVMHILRKCNLRKDVCIARVTYHGPICFRIYGLTSRPQVSVKLWEWESGELIDFIQCHKLLPKLTIDTPRDFLSNLCLRCDGPNLRRPKMLKCVPITWWHHYSTEGEMMPFGPVYQFIL